MCGFALCRLWSYSNHIFNTSILVFRYLFSVTFTKLIWADSCCLLSQLLQHINKQRPQNCLHHSAFVACEQIWPETLCLINSVHSKHLIPCCIMNTYLIAVSLMGKLSTRRERQELYFQNASSWPVNHQLPVSISASGAHVFLSPGQETLRVISI